MRSSGLRSVSRPPIPRRSGPFPPASRLRSARPRGAAFFLEHAIISVGPAQHYSTVDLRRAPDPGGIHFGTNAISARFDHRPVVGRHLMPAWKAAYWPFLNHSGLGTVVLRVPHRAPDPGEPTEAQAA